MDRYLKRAVESGLAYAEIGGLSETELEKLLKNKRRRKKEKSGLEADFQYIHKELKQKGATRQLLWEEYIRRDPDG
ncbi:MAG: hypothetical protein GY866_04490 [Proteobacteria bacterium]|nr:hypothetical protein [Pseudomonadota bacterium]